MCGRVYVQMIYEILHLPQPVCVVYIVQGKTCVNPYTEGGFKSHGFYLKFVNFTFYIEKIFLSKMKNYGLKIKKKLK